MALWDQPFWDAGVGREFFPSRVRRPALSAADFVERRQENAARKLSWIGRPNAWKQSRQKTAYQMEGRLLTYLPSRGFCCLAGPLRAHTNAGPSPLRKAAESGR